MTRKEFLICDDQIVTQPRTYDTNSKLIARCHECFESKQIGIGTYYQRRKSGPWVCFKCMRIRWSSIYASKLRDKIALDYKSGLSSLSIAKKYGINKKTVLRQLNHKGIKRRSISVACRKYQICEKFFDKIDTESKSYWLGFLLADGHIRYSGRNNKSGSLRVCLQARDRPHLVKLREHIKSNHPIKRYFRKKDKRVYYTLDLHSNKLTDTLVRRGWHEFKKHGDCRIMKVHCRLQQHLIRGLIDGDGHFHMTEGKWSKYHKKIVRITSAFSFVDMHEPVVRNMQEWLCGKLGLCATKLTIYENKAVLHYGGNRQVPKILNLLYKEATIFLDRKYHRYKHINDQLTNR